MKAMQESLCIALCIAAYFNYQKCYVFLIIAYFYSSTELEKSVEQVLPGREGGGEESGGGGRWEK
jgi:hypothetical protein